MSLTLRSLFTLIVLFSGSLARAQTLDPDLLAFPFANAGDTYFEVHVDTSETAGTLLYVFRLSHGVIIFEQVMAVADGRVPVQLATPIQDDEAIAFVAAIPGYDEECPTEIVRCFQLRGDVNLDQSVDMEDVFAMLRYLGYMTPIPDEAFSTLVADADDDHDVDLIDAQLVYCSIIGMGGPLVPVSNGLDLSLLDIDDVARIDSLIAAMADNFNQFRATQATWLLFEERDAAVTALIAAAAATPTATMTLSEPLTARRSSEMPEGGTRLAAAYLLLIEAMRLGVTSPFGYSEFLDEFTGERASDTQLGLIVSAFQAWNAAWNGVALSSRPPVDLSTTGARFPTHYAEDDASETTQGGPQGQQQGPWIYKDVKKKKVGNNVWTYVQRCYLQNIPYNKPDKPDEKCTRTVTVMEFNCYHYALACSVTGEALPRTGGAGETGGLKGLLEGHGFDSDNPMDKDPGVAGAVLIMKVRCNDEEPWKPIHAMKREANGKWSSKNGIGKFHQNIDDPEAFAKKSYPKKCKDGKPAKVKFCYYKKR